MSSAAVQRSGPDRAASRVAMKQLFVASAGVALLGLGLAARDAQAPAPPPRRARRAPARRAARRATPPRPGAARAAPATPAMVAAEQTRLVTTYCATCHSERGKAGGLSLASFDAMKAHEQPEVIEKMIRKLRAGMMPPAGAEAARRRRRSTRSPPRSSRAWTSSRPATPTRAGGRSSASPAPSTRAR